LKRALLLLLILYCITFAYAQKRDSVHFHSPVKATIYSAVLPGAGQVYNHQAWKIGLFYAGLGTLGYFVYSNNVVYKDYLHNWINLTDSDQATVVDAKYYGYSAEALHNGFSTFRQYRDQCAIGFILVYAANIIDANVFAHLYNFNVEDISFRPQPVYDIATRSYMPGIRIKYSF
jgi:hypothetical protein